jgi:hypothetical protein
MGDTAEVAAQHPGAGGVRGGPENVSAILHKLPDPHRNQAGLGR